MVPPPVTGTKPQPERLGDHPCRPGEIRCQLKRRTGSQTASGAEPRSPTGLTTSSPATRHDADHRFTQPGRRSKPTLASLPGSNGSNKSSTPHRSDGTADAADEAELGLPMPAGTPTTENEPFEDTA